MERTRQQLTIEALDRIIQNTDKQIEVLKGFDDPLSQELRKVKMQLANRKRKLELRIKG